MNYHKMVNDDAKKKSSHPKFESKHNNNSQPPRKPFRRYSCMEFLVTKEVVEHVEKYFFFPLSCY